METTIDANTKISQLLRFDRELVITTLVNLNGKFSKLRNPILRNLLVKRVSIADACKISQTPLADFLRSMEQIGFRVTKTAEEAVAPEVPAEITFVDPPDYLELDVRPILALHKDPLKEILDTVKLLKTKQGLKLINTFEPLPLIHLLAEKGFAYRVVQEAPDLVITYFNRAAQNSGSVEIPVVAPIIDTDLFDQAIALFSPEKLTTIDVRALEMPKPMLSILEHAAVLAHDGALFVYHKKIPVYLLPELEKQGLTYLFKNIGPGDVHMLIFHP